jgi:hypothetical protein
MLLLCCCCDIATTGAGGFYSSGSGDTYFTSFPGAAGFQQGGAGAIPTFVSTYSNGGFGGGGTANYQGSCNSLAGPGKHISLFICIYIYLFIYIFLSYLFTYLFIISKKKSGH